MLRLVHPSFRRIGLLLVGPLLAGCGFFDTDLRKNRAAFVASFECPNCSGGEDPQYGAVDYVAPGESSPDCRVQSDENWDGERKEYAERYLAEKFCNEFGGDYCRYRVRRTKRETPRFGRFLAERCRRGHPRACTFLGKLFKDGHSVAERPECAPVLAREACEDGYTPGCEYYEYLTTDWQGSIQVY